MTFIALDDEPLALVLVERLAREAPDWTLVKSFTDAAAAAHFVRNNTVDLVISDINMPDVSGLEFVRQLPEERPLVIFLTAYKEHAHEGFDLEVVDYLVKPVRRDRFLRALERAAERINQLEPESPVPENEDHFYVFSEYEEIKVVTGDIRYVESMGDYVKIHLTGQDRPVVTLERLKNLSKQLRDRGFQRIHRSYLVNLASIDAKQKSKVRVGEDWLPVGETYAQQLADRLGT
ncbi:MAG: LytTR family DNA-binding domain-containing protein [Lewinella sp.]